MAWLGLDAEPAQLAFHTLAHHAPTPSHAPVREPLDRRSIQRWKGYATELAPVFPVLANAVERSGYAASGSPDASADTRGPTVN